MPTVESDKAVRLMNGLIAMQLGRFKLTIGNTGFNNLSPPLSLLIQNIGEISVVSYVFKPFSRTPVISLFLKFRENLSRGLSPTPERFEGNLRYCRA